MKNYIFAGILLFFGITALIGETDSFFGYHLFAVLSQGFGEYYQWVFSPVLILFSVYLFINEETHFDLYRIIGLLMYLAGLTTLIGFFHAKTGYEAVFNLFPTLNDILGGTTTGLLFFLLFIVSLVILFQFSFIHFTHKIFGSVQSVKDNFSKDVKKTYSKAKTVKQTRTETKKIKAKEKEFDTLLKQLKAEKEALAKQKKSKQMNIKEAPRKVQIEKKKKTSVSNIFTKKDEKQTAEKIKSVPVKIGTFSNWDFPSTQLLAPPKGDIKVDQNEIRRKEIEIQEKLLQFKIDVEMEGYNVGPTVIQYRLKPKQGVKLQRIVNLKKDLALALRAKSIRIQAPIPGLGAVGIEVPNADRQGVSLREVIESREFNSKKYNIPLALGRDVNGDMIVGDLTKMPHMLIAGQTGSGKSVGMNAFLMSMLYKFSPSELKFIMVDPKRVELSVYNGIPHLLTPVITNPDKALNSLKWCVAEMLRRYDLATSVNARNLQEYNKKVSKKEKLPYIVIVIDELADLMMSGNKKEVEQSIARIAQMARAVGMHLMVATQRPSVDVITGLIKSNIPSRIAFTVASQIDSRTVIDKGGAEDLLGRGDMLYYPTGALEATRVQGVYVDTSEVEAVVNHVKLTIEPDMVAQMQDDTIANGKSKFDGSIMEGYKGEQDEDPKIIEKAIELVKKSQKGSTSLIQRKLGLGYARAAKVLDILEDLGVVGPSNGSKPREVYVD